jgi:hypothetical protein
MRRSFVTKGGRPMDIRWGFWKVASAGEQGGGHSPVTPYFNDYRKRMSAPSIGRGACYAPLRLPSSNDGA